MSLKTQKHTKKTHQNIHKTYKTHETQNGLTTKPHTNTQIQTKKTQTQTETHTHTQVFRFYHNMPNYFQNKGHCIEINMYVWLH